MPYTATTLADFMETVLQGAGTAFFGADPSTHAAIADAVAEVAAVLSVATIDELTDDLKTRTIARWQAWLAAKGAAAGQYDLASEGDSLKRSQFWDHIAAMLADAELAASRYDEAAAVIYGGATAQVSGMDTQNSPYGYPRSEWGY